MSAKGQNLLKNPDGDEAFKYWEVVANGGDGWKIEDVSDNDSFHFIAPKYFVASFEPCVKRQVIDLLNEGFSPEDLDKQPLVKIKDWHGARTDCGCVYHITVALLDENQKVIQRFKPSKIILDPGKDYVGWQTVTHTFSRYGPGLRYISFEHGGQDTKWWKGWYGPHITGSSVILK